MTSFDSYILCTTPRSCSTLLCAMLRETGCAGDPQSYFHRPSLAEWCAVLNLPQTSSLLDIIAQACRVGSADTLIFGLRMQRHSFDFWITQLSALHPDQQTDLDRITATFGRTKFIYLTRKDKIAQAVSLVRAEQSGLWHRKADGSELERLSPPQDEKYDHQAIAAKLAELTGYEHAWESWFTDNNVQPLTVSYDALTEAPRQIVHEILDTLGIDFDPSLDIAPPTAKLADAVNLRWAQRFAQEIA